MLNKKQHVSIFVNVLCFPFSQVFHSVDALRIKISQQIAQTSSNQRPCSVPAEQQLASTRTKAEKEQQRSKRTSWLVDLVELPCRPEPILAIFH